MHCPKRNTLLAQAICAYCFIPVTVYPRILSLRVSDDAFIAVAFNPGQLIINRHDVQETLLALKHRIQIVCAVDGVIDLAAGRGIAVPLGQGVADFPELIGMLEDVQYRGRYVVGRADSPIQELTDGISYLKQL